MASGVGGAGSSYVGNDYVTPVATDHVIPAVEDHVISVIKDEFRAVWYLKDAIDKVTKLVETFKDAKEVAENVQLEDEAVRKWLSDYKNVVYDVEDVVCDYREMVVRHGQGVVRRSMGQAKDGLLVLCGIPLSCLRDILPFPFPARIDIAHRIRSINKTLAEIDQRRANLVILAGESSGKSDVTITEGAVVGPQLWKSDEWPMIGRNEIKTEIKQNLLKHIEGSCSKLLVIGIVGDGGMGKTALAHYILSDENVTKAFDIVRWLYVGEKMDIIKIMNEIILREDCAKLEDPTELHSAVREMLTDKSALIVLDDARQTSTKEWDLLQNSLSNHVKAHVLIVTTRNKAAVKPIACESEYSEYKLVRVSDDECFKIFERCAFMGQNANQFPALEGLSKQVVEKLKGVPLAAEIIGGLMSNYLDDCKKWISIANDKMWFETYDQNLVDRVIELSYHHLPSHLRACFAYCALFPKGFKFDKKTLVRMWIALDYIQTSGKKLMEHTGKAYFDDLYQRSLFQFVNIQTWSTAKYYTMHDLIHDFAQKIFPEGWQVNPNDKNQIDLRKRLSREIYHLLFEDGGSDAPPTSLVKLDVFKKLRTLICYGTHTRLEDAPLYQFRYLRLLIIRCYNMRKLSNSIRHLKLLRYLDVSATRITSLSKGVCDLINLQFLKLPSDCKLPAKGMQQLVNLRFLDAGNYREIKNTCISGIGKLTFLQGRNLYFTVLDKSGWRISELKGLNYLHGTLTIDGLECVKCKGEAERACLKDKKYLDSLNLQWSYIAEQQDHINDDLKGESQILEGLSPPPFLKYLFIGSENHRVRLPCWMDDLPSTLVELHLHGCRSWERLPTLGRLPSLKILEFMRIESVRKIGAEFYGGDGGYRSADKKATLTDEEETPNIGRSSYFPRLEKLSLCGMEELEEWGVPPADDGHGDASILLFPSLRSLCIFNCPKIRTFSPVLPHLTSLRYMELRSCYELTWMMKRDGDGCSLLPSLNHLFIDWCPNLTSVPPINQSGSHKLESNHIVKAANDFLGDLSLPSFLMSLTIDYRFHGVRLPCWMDHMPSTMVCLELEIYGDLETPPMSHEDCCDWGHLPTLGHQESLKKLVISDINTVVKIGPEFYGDDVGETEDNPRTTNGEGTPSAIAISYFPCLTEILFRRMVSLEEWGLPLGVERINDDDNDNADSDGGHRGGCRHDQRPRHVSTSSTLIFLSLTILRIEQCEKLRTLSTVLPHMTALQKLKIDWCDDLTSLAEENRGGRGCSLPCLRSFGIKHCPKLTSLSPINLSRSIKLKTIKILECPGLTSLVGDDDDCLPPSLEFLGIFQCPLLEVRWREGGADHCKIPTTTRSVI